MADQEKKNEYGATLNLPQTDFEMRGNLPQKEPAILEQWNKMGIYRRVLEKNAGKPKFILHDGPPYANGDIHLGHALNKVLKDMIVKYKSMSGFDAPYVPGFDPGFSQMAVGVSIPELGSSNVCFRITEDGHLWTNLLRACFGFNIGEERAKALIEKINENYTGVELIYDEPAPGTAAENEEGAAGDGAQDDGIVIEYTSEAAAPDTAGEEILSE